MVRTILLTTHQYLFHVSLRYLVRFTLQQLTTEISQNALTFLTTVFRSQRNQIINFVRWKLRGVTSLGSACCTSCSILSCNAFDVT